VEEEGLTRLAVPVNEEDHSRGPADAPITLVEYGDFECPFCGQAYPIVKALERKYDGQLRVVFRSFPLEQHRFAEQAAETAEFAADHGEFWEMHDLLYEHQSHLDRGHLLEYAKRLGLDETALAEALRAETYRPVIDEVKEGGEESGIPGTPAFFLNDVLFEEDPTLETFSNAIDWLLEHGS
jgi:protein-disulfide isomerase